MPAGVCLSASQVPLAKSKVMQRPASSAAQCNVLCATKQEVCTLPTVWLKQPLRGLLLMGCAARWCTQVLQRCQNAAGMHVGDAKCTGFTFSGCAYSCSDDCEHGCEVQRYESVCDGMRIGM